MPAKSAPSPYGPSSGSDGRPKRRKTTTSTTTTIDPDGTTKTTTVTVTEEVEDPRVTLAALDRRTG